MFDFTNMYSIIVSRLTIILRSGMVPKIIILVNFENIRELVSSPMIREQHEAHVLGFRGFDAAIMLSCGKRACLYSKMAQLRARTQRVLQRGSNYNL